MFFSELNLILVNILKKYKFNQFEHNPNATSHLEVLYESVIF